MLHASVRVLSQVIEKRLILQELFEVSTVMFKDFACQISFKEESLFCALLTSMPHIYSRPVGMLFRAFCS